MKQLPPLTDESYNFVMTLIRRAYYAAQQDIIEGEMELVEKLMNELRENATS